MGVRRAWAQTMVSASHWVGLTLPGMMLLPGSFSGSFSSPRPHRGPLPRKRMSFPICGNQASPCLSSMTCTIQGLSRVMSAHPLWMSGTCTACCAATQTRQAVFTIWAPPIRMPLMTQHSLPKQQPLAHWVRW